MTLTATDAATVGSESWKRVPKLPEPEGPLVDPILQIHRGTDAFISFHR